MGKEVPFLKLKLDSIGAQVKVRSFDVVVESYLGGLYLQHLMFKGKWNLIFLLAYRRG